MNSFFFGHQLSSNDGSILGLVACIYSAAPVESEHSSPVSRPSYSTSQQTAHQAQQASALAHQEQNKFIPSRIRALMLIMTSRPGFRGF